MILVINTGSSSIKYKVFDEKNNLAEISASAINDIGKDTGQNHSGAALKLIDQIKQNKFKIDSIGYRVVHGGGELKNGALATSENLAILSNYSSIAPLHNPPALEVIKACEPAFGRAKHYLYFDTDFFSSLPEEETAYPLPYDMANDLGIRRFGFHGISHKHAQSIADPKDSENVITIHLGAGCSITAINCGKPVATSMGYTPDEGLMMQTRTGNIDPGIILYLSEKYGVEKTRSIIENDSGLSGVSGTDGSMLNILYLCAMEIEDPDYSSKIERTEKNNHRAKLALKLYINRIVMYISYYATLLHKVDKLVFTGKIGAGSSVIRNLIIKKVENLPINEYVTVKPDEELQIAREILSNQP